MTVYIDASILLNYLKLDHNEPEIRGSDQCEVNGNGYKCDYEFRTEI